MSTSLLRARIVTSALVAGGALVAATIVRVWWILWRAPGDLDFHNSTEYWLEYVRPRALRLYPIWAGALLLIVFGLTLLVLVRRGRSVPT